MENKGKTINSEGFPEGEAQGTSWGIYRLSFIFHIRILYSPAQSLIGMDLEYDTVG